MFKADYHIHTQYSVDSEAPIREVIEKAISLGLDEIALTDHVDFDPRYPINDYKQLIPIIQELKEEYSKKIFILIAVELGLENRWEKAINSFTNDFSFDFIIGSSHQVCAMDLYYDRELYFGNKTKKQAYNTYLEEMLFNIDTCPTFSVYGHLDYVARYGMYEDNSLKYSDFSDLIDEVLKKLIDKGKGIEINTSGFRYGINDNHPNIEIIKRYRELGGEILTCGSDAHKVKDVADRIDHAYYVAAKAGFRYITAFRNMKPIFKRID